jgi:hypothetical protein
MARPTTHDTWVHQDFKYDDPRRKPLLVECVLCGVIERGIGRREDAKKIGVRHEKEFNHG